MIAHFNTLILFPDKPYFVDDVNGGGGGLEDDAMRSTFKSFKVSEGQTASVNLTALANPDTISYTWTHPRSASMARVFASGSVLTVRDAHKGEAGNYTVVASNAHGDFKTTFTIRVDVQYPPR